MMKYGSIFMALSALLLSGCGGGGGTDGGTPVGDYDYAEYLPASSGDYVTNKWYQENESAASTTDLGSTSLTYVITDDTVTSSDGGAEQTVCTIGGLITCNTEGHITQINRYYDIGDAFDSECIVAAHYSSRSFSAFGEEGYQYDDVLQIVCEDQDNNVSEQYVAKGLGVVARINFDCFDDEGNLQDNNDTYSCDSSKEYRSFLDRNSSTF